MIAAIERRTSNHYWRWATAVVWMGLIFYLSSRSKLPRPEPISANLEAIAGHLGAYGVLALLVSFALSGYALSAMRRSAYAVLFAVIYGISDEIHQSFVPGRDPAVFDVALDFVGASLAMVGWQLVCRWRQQAAI